MDKFPGTITRMPPHGKIVLSEEQEAWFRKWFPEVENSRLMKASGLTHDTLHRLARARSLKKSKKGLAGIKKRRSEIQKENWRKETRRLVLGMSRKSKLKAVSKPYTKSQLCRRNNCLKFGYFLSTDHSEQGGERYIIYYDDNTDRRPKFEKNCIADGFTFIYEPS